MNIKSTILITFILALFCIPAVGQHSIARQWNDLLLESIRGDFARPTVHARNLFHTSIAMYDVWAIFDETAEPFLIGKTVNGFDCPFDGFPAPTDMEAARDEAICHAVYRILTHRFQNSPAANMMIPQYQSLMSAKGYSINNLSLDYSTGNAAALGNYIAACILNFGLQDGSNESVDYGNAYYTPVNPPLVTDIDGNPDIIDFNRWQPLTLDVFIDQSGNIIPFNTPKFLGPEWGNVTPFALSQDDVTIYSRFGDDYQVYHDPGDPPYLDTENTGGISEEYKWGFELVSIWGAHNDPADGVMWDISPGSIGNIQSYPENYSDYDEFYDLINGGDPSIGHSVNPVTGMPYEPQMVPRGDYTRVLAEYWADGPDSETPPGHWFTILNYVNDHPMFEKRYRGQGPIIDDLEWDVKGYLMMGGAMHDSAITAWGIKGWYDYLRPISAIRAMGDLGQSSDPNLPSYHPGGFRLTPGYIELIEVGDPLAGFANQHVGKIKLYTWKGPDYINNPAIDVAGVGWIRAEEWWPYQRPSFVTPPFAGFISGHSTFSSAAADIMEFITGDDYFPGGMGEFEAPMNNFLVFENGPSVDITLQWATYRDASDQTSLSRIWGGIHPPADDIHGRKIGMEIAADAVLLAESLFYKDDDNDGFYNYTDCDDNDNTVYPGAPEICDDKDNDCNSMTDDGLPLFTYYQDADNDGFGDAGSELMVCLATAPAGFVTNSDDCDDTLNAVNPNITEICDGIDNDCNGLVDDNLPVYDYYLDVDGDGFGDSANEITTCENPAPTGYVANAQDCNDNDNSINPSMTEVCDDVDNNCSGAVDDGLTYYDYYRDQDADGFGDGGNFVSTCYTIPPTGYVTNSDDCNDVDATINPTIAEVCDGIDNDCNGMADDGLTVTRYYRDIDGDNFGNPDLYADTCISTPPTGYVTLDGDCDDNNALLNPNAIDVADNFVDEDCDGADLFLGAKIFPNPVNDELIVRIQYQGEVSAHLISMDGRLMLRDQIILFNDNTARVDVSELHGGVYILRILDDNENEIYTEKVLKY